MELTSFSDWPLAISIMLVVLVIGLPIESEISQRIFKPAIERGAPGARLSTYRYSIFSLWALALPVLVIWQVCDLDWALLGFQWDWNFRLMGVCIVSILIAGFFGWQAWSMQTTAAARTSYAEALRAGGGTYYFMPVSSIEHRTFIGLGVTAGITEEIIFRGFLIWAFAFFMPLWAAGLSSHLIFTMMHRYQGLAGMAQVFVIGAVITCLYIVGGSIWPLIALHIAVDVLHAITYRLGRLQLEDLPDTGSSEGPAPEFVSQSG